MSLPNPSDDTMVVVTGAASGIGRELARQLAARGHHLFLVDIDAKALATVAGELRNLHPVSVDTHECDLTNARQRDALIATVRRDARSIVGLCNNAGIFSMGRFVDLPYGRESAMVHLNALAVHHLVGALAPDLVARGEGAILNTTSLAGNQPLPYAATYSATKAFAHAFSEALWVELRGTGVSCTSLQPSLTRTAIAEAAGIEQTASAVPNVLWSSAQDVARVGIKAMIAGRRTAVPGLPNRTLAVGFGRYTPRGAWLRIARAVASRRVQPMLDAEPTIARTSES